MAAINKVWKKKFDAGQVTHEQLTLNQEAQGAIKIQGGIFENAQTPVRTLTTEDMQKLVEIQKWQISLEKSMILEALPVSPNRLARTEIWRYP